MTGRQLSNLDTLLLRMDSPVHPVVVTGILVLGTRIDLDQLKSTIETRLLRLDGFRQRIIPSRLAWRTSYWEDGLDLDLDYHVQRVILSPTGDQAALQDIVSELAGAPLDMTRPPWQMHLVEPYGPGCAVVCRAHHSLADGAALVHVILSLSDADAAAPPSTAEPMTSQRGPDVPRRRPVTKLMHRGLRGLSHLRHVPGLPQLAGDLAATVGDIVLSPSDADTGLRGTPSLPKRIAWSGPIPLDEIKSIGARLGGTVNDVLLTALTGALQRYLQARQQDLPADASFRAIIPMNRRPPGAEAELGNQFTAGFLPLPIGITDPAERLAELRRRMDELKESLQPALVLAALEVIGRAPAPVLTLALGYMSTKATAIVTNVKGPQERLYLSGAPVEEMMAWIPRYGGIGVGISILSYADQVRLGVISDKDIMPDPENLIAGFHDEVAALLALAREVKRPLSIKEASDLLDKALATLNQLVPNDAE
jgi:WS/DGAT/MGAT family acyltransferase